MQKQQVGHIAVSGIIYRAANPAQIFTAIKDATYPHVVWRGCICLIGGNWTGKGNVRYDMAPIQTFAREVAEELLFAKPMQSTADLGETSVSHTMPTNYRAKEADRQSAPEDEADLLLVKQAIIRRARSFDDYILTIPPEVFLRADPESTQPTITALCCVLEIGLDEETWAILARLQRDFGNLSCESESYILTIADMTERNILAMSGYDQILQEFFEVKEVMRGRALPADHGVSVRRASLHPRFSYGEYLKHYSVARKPEGW